MIMREEHRMEILALFQWCFPDMQNFTQHFDELDACSSKRALVLIGTATVLMYDFRIILL